MSEWSALGYAITELGRDILDVAPELSAATGGIRDKEDGACAECIPSSPGKGVAGFRRHHPTDAVNHPQELGIGDSPIFDRHGDNRFADNILRALDGLPQNGDDEEERDAAEEGALIEASGMPDPAHDPRWA